ncbi:sodium/bile acid cotransporter 7 [Sphingomonas sp. BE138]|uniref:bile acid:sodium symporter family protein n=1 Tax=Sphingomonas sp. BE138 TaxID=2817845 RepID=UPI002858ACB6|nr:bile acid:sodium symporter family protein [Sphingomonas sp. BE138]MDR6787525.1 sodium/bile acid cotransporter 7 [Sphingomonas sp. BE138]
MLRRVLARADRFLLLLIATVALAAVLPARGEVAVWVEHSTVAAVALLFLLYGARLAPQAIWAGLANWRLQSMVFASTYAFFPLVGLGVAAATRAWLPREVVDGLLFLCLLPSTVQSSIAFTSIARGNVPAALCAASLSNLAGVILTPLLVAHLLTQASGGLSLAALEEIALQILLPFAIGQAIRPWAATWLRAHPTLTSVVDRGSVLVVVYAAFSAGVVAGIWTRLSPLTLVAVLAVSLVVLAIVIAGTTIASRAAGFPVEDEIATVFCGSKKSMASGIPMAAILFPAASVGLIVLPLMIFHQAQLFVCAWLARRYSVRAAE